MHEDKIRMKLLDELVDHLEGLQASDLRELLSEVKEKEAPPAEGMESDPSLQMEGGEEPKGLEVEKIEINPNDPKDPNDELSDEDLEELMRH